MKSIRKDSHSLHGNSNPFNIGSPARGKGFFNREEIIEEVNNFLLKPNEYHFLIFGQRRIGKTSLLRKIQDDTNMTRWKKAIYFNLQDKAEFSIGDILYELTEKIILDLNLDLKLDRSQFAGNYAKNHFKTVILPTILKKNKNIKQLILLFDEFDVFAQNENTKYEYLPDNFACNHFVSFMVEVIEELQEYEYPVKLIFAIGRNYKDLKEAHYGQITKFGRQVELIPFSRKHIKDFIINFCKDNMVFEDAAIDSLFALTSGHPYFTQCLASASFDSIARKKQNKITAKVVEMQFIPALKKVSSGIFWIWKSFPSPHKIILYIIARLGEEKKQVTVDLIRKKAAQLNLVPALEKLEIILYELSRLKFIKIDNGYVSFNVEFIRKWIAIENDEREITQLLEKIDKDLSFELFNAHYYLEKKNFKKAIEHFKNVLIKNPSHLESIFQLAKIYWGFAYKKEVYFEQAINYFQLAYNINPRMVRDDYLLFLFEVLKVIEVIKRSSMEIINEVSKVLPPNQVAIEELITICIRKKLSFAHLPFLDMVKKLDLKKQQIEEIPSELVLLKHLEHLDLRDNKISRLPETILHLKNLKEILLTGNHLNIPIHILDGSLEKVKKYVLPRDREIINSIQKEIGKQLFPVLFEELQSKSCSFVLDEEKHVIGLNLSDCSLSDIPDNLFKLSALVSLILSKNNIIRIPDSVMTCKELKYLDISNNQLIQFPFSILKETKLEYINLKNNKITQISEYLIQSGLEIHWNRFFNFIDKGINLYNNPLESPPVEIVRQGIKVIKQYFYSLSSENTVRLFEAKVILVGQGGVGKTSIMRKLINLEYMITSNEYSTEGINIVNWKTTLPYMKSTMDFTICFWDFGGQEIYHATHQFFLTKRSLYLFVWQARMEDHYVFDYWLNIIKLLSNSSPVLVVMNKADLRIREIDQERLKEQFPNVMGFYQVSAKTGKGMATLQQDILKHVAQLPHIGDTLPRVWVKIRDRLEQLNQNYISYDRFISICDEEGLDQKRAKYISNYYHDLGVFLHFREDLLLQDIIILKPEWTTTAIYQVLDNRKILETRGRLTTSHLKEIWKNYPADKHPHLLRLMEKFELVFRLGNSNTYIVPELLSSDEPMVKEEPHQEYITLEYHYNFMPAGIITRFIVRQSMNIDGNLLWRNGVYLCYGDNRAKVLVEPLYLLIRITVWGKDRRDILLLIRNEFDYIHKTLNNPEVKELVPCICTECKISREPFFYDLNVLNHFMEKGKATIPCMKSTESISIKSLLEGYQIPTEATWKWDVFISYSSKDHRIIIKLVEDFRKQDIRYWLDDEQILPGDLIVTKIEEGINNSRILLFCLSRNQLDSGWSRYESQAIINKSLQKRTGQKICPLILDDMDIEKIPPLLRNIKVNFLNNKESYTQFLDFIKKKR